MNAAFGLRFAAGFFAAAFLAGAFFAARPSWRRASSRRVSLRRVSCGGLLGSGLLRSFLGSSHGSPSCSFGTSGRLPIGLKHALLSRDNAPSAADYTAFSRVKEGAFRGKTHDLSRRVASRARVARSGRAPGGGRLDRVAASVTSAHGSASAHDMPDPPVNLAALRTEYQRASLDERDVARDPFASSRAGSTRRAPRACPSPPP